VVVEGRVTSVSTPPKLGATMPSLRFCTKQRNRRCSSSSCYQRSHSINAIDPWQQKLLNKLCEQPHYILCARWFCTASRSSHSLAIAPSYLEHYLCSLHAATGLKRQHATSTVLDEQLPHQLIPWGAAQARVEHRSNLRDEMENGAHRAVGAAPCSARTG
jgi:hypothetical protein